jgi:hypothetical protein
MILFELQKLYDTIGMDKIDFSGYHFTSERKSACQEMGGRFDGINQLEARKE